MKATILVVDCDERSLEILQRDMARRYGADYDVLSASSSLEAARLQERLARENRIVALAIAYQWMPEMTGIDLLSQSREYHPGAMRALMIDVGDLRAEQPIIRALTLNHIDYYFGKPWASPEEELYPTTGEALRVWSSTHLPRLEKIKFIGEPAVVAHKHFGPRRRAQQRRHRRLPARHTRFNSHHEGARADA